MYERYHIEGRLPPVRAHIMLSRRKPLFWKGNSLELFRYLYLLANFLVAHSLIENDEYCGEHDVRRDDKYVGEDDTGGQGGLI